MTRRTTGRRLSANGGADIGITTIERIIDAHSAEIEHIRRELAMNFDVPAQGSINAGFARMGIERFDRNGNDLWEMITCHQNGWEYSKPPAHLRDRWARY